MRRIVCFLVVAMVGAAGIPAVAHPAPLTEPTRREPARLAAGVPARPAPDTILDLVVTLDRPAPPPLAARLAALGPRAWSARHIPVAVVRIPGSRLDALRHLPGVRAVYPDAVLRYPETGDDPPGPAPVPKLLPPGESGAATPVPGLGFTGAGVTVAVVDTGIDFNHPDLAPAMRAGVKVLPFGSDAPLQVVEGVTDTDTTSGHGTHVAGDIAGRGTASDGAYRGSAPGASLVGLGAGEALTVAIPAVLSAYDWIIEHRQSHGIRVINNSYGRSFSAFDPDDPVNQATRAAADAGLVVVFAQGNDGDELTMNGNAVAPWIISVAAGTQARGLADFSSAGLEADVVDPAASVDAFRFGDIAGDPRRPLRMGAYHPSVVALGENVVGTRAAGIVPLLGIRRDLTLPAGRQARYTVMSGTSMAAPEAAGVVALVLEADPALRPADVKRILQITGRPIPGVPFFRQGYGTLDPAAAVGLARQLAGWSPAEVDRTLDERQSARDADVLAAVTHPLHTTAWEAARPGAASPGAGSAAGHPITVEPGTGRLKVVDTGFNPAPFLQNPVHTIVVRDASGREVGRTGSHPPRGSGTTILDLDLTRLPGLAWGTWTVEVSEAGLVPTTFLPSDAITVAATFARPEKSDPSPSAVPGITPPR